MALQLVLEVVLNILSMYANLSGTDFCRCDTSLPFILLPNDTHSLEALIHHVLLVRRVHVVKVTAPPPSAPA